MTENKNVLFVVDNLVMGGVTRVLVNLIRRMHQNGLNIDVMVLHRHEDMSVQLPETVNVINGGKRMASVDASMAKLIRQKDLAGILRKLFFACKIKTGRIQATIDKDRKENIKKAYDAEIAFGDGFPYIYTSRSKAGKKIAWMHSDVTVRDYSQRYRKLLKKILMQYDSCVAVSDKVAQAYQQVYGVKNVCVIHNMMNVEEIKEKALDETETPACEENVLHFVSVGRLDYSKNYPMLLEAAKLLTEKGYDFRISLVGEGTERELLEEKIRQWKLSERVFLLGQKNNPYPYVKNADCFLLSSRYEGLPTVIIEAMILGVPCISTKVAGVEQLLKKEYGLITENTLSAFVEGMERVLKNPQMLDDYKKNLENYTYDNQRIKEEVLRVIHDRTEQ